jgi:Patatin-like phospholipase
MAKSSRSDTTDRTSTDAEHPAHLADVLEREFRELHGGDPPEGMSLTLRDDGSVTKQQQPLADPSLAPARDGAIEQTKIGKTSSPRPLIDDRYADRLRTIWDKIHKLPGDGRTALCLSGGGVRSAAFNLGVLQGLARLELLNRFHYLSTVSGGGYIGCWLNAWRHRSQQGIAELTHDLSWPDRIGDAEESPQVPDAIRHLRCFTNYLTPAAGVLSGDSWASIIIIGRNLILNHIVIVPLVAALLVLAKLVGAVAHEHCFLRVWEWWNDHIAALLEKPLAAFYVDSFLTPGVFASYLGSFFIPGVLAAFGWITLSIARPSWDGRRWSRSRQSPRRSAELWPPRLGIFFVLIGAVLFGLIASESIPKGPDYSWDRGRFWAFPIGGLVGSFVGFLFAVGIAMLKRALCSMPRIAKRVAGILGYVPRNRVTVPTAGFCAIAALAVAAAVAGFAGGLVLGAGEELAAHLLSKDPVSTALVLSIAPFWFVISYNAGEAVFLGLTARRPGLRRLNWSDRWGDEEREWVARTCGWLTLSALSISILLLLSLFGAYLFDIVTSGQWNGVLLTTIGILSAVASIGLAASPFSSHFGTALHRVRLPVRTILAVATPRAIGLLPFQRHRPGAVYKAAPEASSREGTDSATDSAIAALVRSHNHVRSGMARGAMRWSGRLQLLRGPFR